MTFKSLLNFGSSNRNPTPPVDRYHTGPSDYGHYEHGSSYGGHRGGKGGGGGGGGAALSALTLLAFLFLINVMQQSLDNNNGTTTTTTFFSRGDEQPVVVDAREDEGPTKIVTDDTTADRKYVPIKTSLQVVKKNRN